ncbi:response regulator transcription factor [Ilumatobacter nonamiensis]|uniref:response regulator transcription factor n=1 Tax=Ilumatobacter nonamiensis TaxID=467093 RepID=UPI00058EC265|nr:response regulator transcription factor [Ilumatobacter nonamiensis]
MRLLVVEDEVKLANSLHDGLTADGFAVDVANDGNDGLWMATTHTYDAIVLDIMLPGVNGFVICRTLREQDIWTPILMLTAKDGDLDEAEALDTGADDYLRKPFSHVVLVARIRSLLRRGADVRPTILTAGDLVLDPGRRSCRRADTPIELTAREFAVLEYLMSNAGSVLSKQDILDHVWDVDFAGDANIVEVYVGHLRKKIDEPFGTASIETVRGAGYRLREGGE